MAAPQRADAFDARERERRAPAARLLLVLVARRDGQPRQLDGGAARPAARRRAGRGLALDDLVEQRVELEDERAVLVAVARVREVDEPTRAGRGRCRRARRRCTQRARPTSSASGARSPRRPRELVRARDDALRERAARGARARARGGGVRARREMLLAHATRLTRARARAPARSRAQAERARPLSGRCARTLRCGTRFLPALLGDDLHPLPRVDLALGVEQAACPRVSACRAASRAPSWSPARAPAAGRRRLAARGAPTLVESSASAAVSTTHAVPLLERARALSPRARACAAMRLKNLA